MATKAPRTPKSSAPKAPKPALMTLEELYALPKKTPSVMKAILLKEDFSKTQPGYCENVCPMKCKQPQQVALLNSEVDVLIIQDHRNPPSRWDKFEGQQDRLIGGILDLAVKQAGMSSLRYRLTSVMKCPATNQDFPKGKPPTPVALMKCSPYLMHELKVSKPKVIVSLSTAATKALKMKQSNTGNRGDVGFTFIQGEDAPIPVVITIHPRILQYVRQNARGSAGMWGPDYFRVLVRDLAKAVKIATGEVVYTPNSLKEAVEDARSRITVTRSLEDVANVAQLLSSLPEKAVISCDTETTGVDVLAPNFKLLCIQFGWRDPETRRVKAAVIPLWHRENSSYPAEEAWKLVEPLVTSPARIKVGHNAKYDITAIFWATQLLFGTGVRAKGFTFDTMLLAHSIESGRQGTYGLKDAVFDYLFETKLGGYEDLLGSLKDIQKQRALEAEQHEDSISSDPEVSSLI